MEGEAVDRVDNGPSTAVDVDDGDGWRSNGSREGRRTNGRLAGPVEVRGTKFPGSGKILVPQSSSGEALGHRLDRGV